MWKRLTAAETVRRWLGLSLAHYLRLVQRTTRFVAEPADYRDHLVAAGPAIIAMWHGQHFIVPLAQPGGLRFAVMISRSTDGDINAVAAEALGIATVRASGGRNGHQIKKRGGARGLIEAVRLLRDGVYFAVTADVPKGPARQCGPGIIALARHAQCPIIPIAMATRYSITLPSWDRASLNLPCGRMVLVTGEPIHVPLEAEDDASIARFQAQLTGALDAVTARAARLVKE